MKFLKTAIVAGALAVATLATTAAGAAERFGVYVGRDSFGIGFTSGRVAHRGPMPAHYGNWYAASAVYRPYAFYRARPAMRACFQVTKHGFRQARHVLIAATMCYDRRGGTYVVPGSRHVVRWF